MVRSVGEALVLFRGGLILLAIPLLSCPLWARASADVNTAAQEQNRAQIEIQDDVDDPEVWDTANSFEKAPSLKNTKKAFEILEQKLDDWTSHPAGVVTTILHAIGDHRVQEGRPYLIRFLQSDPRQPSAGYVASVAALALGDLGGPGALEALKQAASQRADEAVSSAAVALGILKDPRGVPTLETLTQHSDSNVRRRAFSALANYCAPTSRVLVLQALSCVDPEVRNAATWWLAACGTYPDGPYLNRQLDDTEPLVRWNAIKGLMRVKSKAGCTNLTRLLADQSLTVREGAEAYKAVCDDP